MAISFSPGAFAASKPIPAKQITLSNPAKSLSISIDCSKGCFIKALRIKNKNVLSAEGIQTGVSLQAGTFSSLQSTNDLKLIATPGGARVSGIRYGNKDLQVTENWNFKVSGASILWSIERSYSADAELTDNAFPKWNFANLKVWKGGILDNGGMVWCKYLKKKDDTYGVHTAGATFWNAESGEALQIAPTTDPTQALASKFSNDQGSRFSFTQILSDQPLAQQHNLSRFVAGHSDIFKPFGVKRGTVKINLKLDYVDYAKKYSRGNLPGIDSISVRELLNTTGRYGVVDNNIIGGNGWLTNWKCLHEPFFAQTGLALIDPNYIKNMASTLDQERDQAMTAEGRVLSRWHDVQGDEIKGTYDQKTGYYEAIWGYTIDSQPGYVINTAEQFDLSGDVNWLSKHKESCERALDWLIKRDENQNGIFEMLNNNIADQKASDWLDIVWASYENAFVNAQMYEALKQWSDCERILGDREKSAHYAQIAARLKSAFNKPIAEGGFWSEEKKQYVYWRDKDGSVHGDNLVTPVNFATIAFGICDDPARIKQVLDQIESRTSAEKLFHWPLCFDSFAPEEVHRGNWPFPKYENGDIFPSWGYLGVRAYVSYDKSIALKYIHNLLDQYRKDGLSSQRYSRTTQLGLGDDILAGISTSITALYRDIYGIRPKWNRMGLQPNLTAELQNTRFNYPLRGKEYQVLLKVNDYQIREKNFTVNSTEAFGVALKDQTLRYYHQNAERAVMRIRSAVASPIRLAIKKWDEQGIQASLLSKGNFSIHITGLKSSKPYEVLINGTKKALSSTKDGSLAFNEIGNGSLNIQIYEKS